MRIKIREYLRNILTPEEWGVVEEFIDNEIYNINNDGISDEELLAKCVQLLREMAEDTLAALNGMDSISKTIRSNDRKEKVINILKEDK